MTSTDFIVNCLTKQLNELEILKSMYPGKGEIIVSDDNVLLDINEFIDKKIQHAPSLLDYALIRHINDLKLEICITLPRTYPNEEPNLYIRCNQLNRQQETNLNKALLDYVKNTHEEGTCSIYTAISWLQDNIDSFSKSAISNDSNVIKSIPDKVVVENFLRLWIYSHHIYNKRKRDEIVNQAKENNLTGFCLPGKPGIICVEGSENSCLEWWRQIKSMSWKKIMIRKTEKFDVIEWKKEHKFTKFEEIYFPNPNAHGNNKHSDISGLSKYLENVGLSHAFNGVFGLCNE